MWKITGPNATIYLFGTIHLLPAEVRWFGGPVARAFAQSDTLVTEILDPSPGTMRALLARTSRLPAGSSLRTMLTPTDRQRLEAVLAAGHLAPATFDRFQPWSAALALATAPMLQMGYDPANGVDHQLGDRASASGLPHEALETASFQLGLFAGLPQPVQQAYLMQVIRHLPEIKPELAAIIAAWEAGHADELARLMNSDDDDPRMMRIVLFDRNRTWARWIAARLAHPKIRHETLFVAVGAGHLAGSGSVQDDLLQLGVAARRVQ